MDDKGKEEVFLQPSTAVTRSDQQNVPNELEAQDHFEMCRSPIGFLKYAALFFFKNGNIDQAIICIKALIEEDNDILNYVGNLEIIVNLAKSGIVLREFEWEIVWLHWSAYNGQIQLVKYFVGLNKFDLEAQDLEGRTPLSYAAQLGYLEVVKYLIAKGANVQSQDKTGKSPLLWAAENGQLETVKVLVQYCDVRVEVCNNKLTALHYAACYGHLQLVKYLVGLNKLDLESQSKNGRTPLVWAYDCDHLEVVEFLLEKGAKIDVIDEDGISSLLAEAFEEGQWEKVMVLVRCCEVVSNEKSTALHYAAADGNIALVEYLVGLNTLDLEAQSIVGVTPLSCAVWFGHIEVVKFLLEKGASVHVKEQSENSPFLMAAREGQLEVVKVLAQYCDVRVVVCNEKLTALHYAARYGHLQLVKYLVGLNKFDLETQSINGRTPLVWACDGGHIEVVKFLLEKDAKIDVRDQDGISPLLRAAGKGQLEMVKVLEKYCDVRLEVCNEKLTALHYAACNGHLGVVEYLVGLNNFNLEAQDIDGLTPLSWAARQGHLHIVKSLHRAGAAIIQKTADGKTALQLAAENGKNEIVEYIACCSMSQPAEILAQVVENLGSDDRRAYFFNTNNFSGISSDQWKIICRCYSEVQFQELNLLSANFLGENEFEELLKRSKNIIKIQFEGNSLLTDKSLREKILNRLSLRILRLYNVNNFLKLSRNGFFSKAENLTELIVDSCKEITLIDLKAPNLLRAYFGNCSQLNVIKLFAEKLEKMYIANCASFSSIEVNAKNCVLNVQALGPPDQRGLYQSPALQTFFSKCVVKKICTIPYHEFSISMLGITKKPCGTSFLHSRLLEQSSDMYLYPMASQHNQKYITIKLSESLECKLFVWNHTNRGSMSTEEDRLPQYIRKSNILIITISYHDIMLYSNKWLCRQYDNVIKKNLSNDCVCILAGTMIDLVPNKKEMDTFKTKLNEFAKENQFLGTCITSAKDNTGIEELRELIKDAIKTFHLKPFPLSNLGTL